MDTIVSAPSSTVPSRRAAVTAFAASIFLSAFLLFQVQPIVGKKILPWFGSTPAVWTTCMLFFQLILLGGYGYAHLLTRRFAPRQQVLIHLLVLAASLAVLPIGPNAVWKPTGDEYPTVYILTLLTACIGAPYFVLSTTGPLLQAWFAKSLPGVSPYRLYALSNAGSLLALLSYPFAVEPWLPWGTQSLLWSVGYGIFVIGCAWCAWRSLQPALAAPTTTDPPRVPQRYPKQTIVPAAPNLPNVLLWLSLSALGSVVLLATTNIICQEVPVVPLLWVVPLALYLLTFILTFEMEWMYHYSRRLLGILFIGCIAWAGVVMYKGPSTAFMVQIAAYLSAMFIACFVCHGELVRAKPEPRHLTLFYLMISLGGAIGGVLVAVVCPLTLNGMWELPLALGAALGFYLARLAYELLAPWPRHRWLGGLNAAAIIGALTTFGVLTLEKNANKNSLTTRRNFYSTLRVKSFYDSHLGDYHQLINGTIDHGSQYRDGLNRLLKSTYYGERSGVGMAIVYHAKMSLDAEQPFKLGVIGLGTGTLAAYGRAADTVRFYEINPEVKKIAEDPEYFSYLSDCFARHANVEVILGDARIRLERELDRQEKQKFDVLAIDAFTSDSIPLHLLTKECMDAYVQHMAEDGVIAFHISNKHLDLRPVVRALAETAGWDAVQVNYVRPPDKELSDTDEQWPWSTSDWVLVTKNTKFVDSLVANKVGKRFGAETPAPILFTDDTASLWRVLRWPKLTWKSLVGERN